VYKENEKGFLFTIESVRSDFTKTSPLLISLAVLGEKVLEINKTDLTFLI
jgi:hypothetical protein